MSNFFHGKMFAKISELDETIEFDTADEFVVVNDHITQKITGQNLTESIVAIGNLASKAYVDAVVDGAPALLDTLNELAAALNDDANFATTITTLISTKLASNDFNSYFDAALAAKTTTALTEGTNLFYTQARFDTAFAAKTTSDVTEGTNLYYTEQRVLDVVIPLVPTSIFDLDVPEVSVNLPGYLHYNGTTLSWESSTNPTYDTVTILAEPTSDSHAATKGYVDSQFNSFESFSGSYNDLTDKPTAPTFDSVTTTNLNAQNVNFIGTGAVTITSGNDLNFVAVGVIAFNSSVSLGTDGKLTLLASPTSDNHAATKGYVDNQITDVVAGQGFATLDYVEDAIISVIDPARTAISTEISTAIDTARTAISTEISTAIDTAELDGGTF